jgi:hypothetical protein
MSEVPKPDIAAAVNTWMPHQSELIEQMNGLVSCWMKRRQEALETGLQAFQKMAACQDPASAAKVCADWMGGSMNRILADVSDARDRSVKMMELGQKAYQAMLSAQAQAAAKIPPALQPVAPAPQATPDPTYRAAA